MKGIILLVVLVGILWIIYASKESMKDAVLSPEDKEILMKSCETKKFIVTNPNNRLEKRVSPSFQYVSWDGGHWIASIIGDTFYIRKMGSSRNNSYGGFKRR